MNTRHFLCLVGSLIILVTIANAPICAQVIGGSGVCGDVTLSPPPTQLLNCSMDPSLICYANNCFPLLTDCRYQRSDACDTAGPTDVCSSSITDSRTYSVEFPDGTPMGTAPSVLDGTGAEQTSYACNGAGIPYPSFPRLKCTPTFSSFASDQNYTARVLSSDALGAYLYCNGWTPYWSYTCASGGQDTAYAVHTCCSQTCNSGGGGGGGGGGVKETDGGGPPAESPIVVDVSDKGYELTDLAHGVSFNFTGKGKQRISWTNPDKGNAWLVLDRNVDGTIDDGTELFGNMTPQPSIPGVAPNGFLALAVFDPPAHGGNGDGIIDPRDAIWTRLRLWIDKNQNGISESEELHTLDEFGVAGIDLRYHVSRFTDQYGNQFRYRGKIMEQYNSHFRKRTVWDVLLLHQP